MTITTFKEKHIEEAASIAMADYEEERKYVPELPAIRNIPGLDDYAANGLGVAAFEGGKMAGFLGCVLPFDHTFRSTDVKGIFSPMGANGAIPQNRSQIYAAMYQAAGAKWVKAGAVSHAVCLYAHDKEAQRQFYNYGFGLRCIDAIREMELIPCALRPDYDYGELPEDKCHLIYPLDLLLNRHYNESPFFMNRTPATLEEFLEASVRENARYFTAEKDGNICAFIRVTAIGETFISEGNAYRHITGAYCLPEHRGKDVCQNLLNFTIAILKAEGYTKLGVDYESMNPTARGFWPKYFPSYTHSVVRRIDERILQKRNDING